MGLKPRPLGRSNCCDTIDSWGDRENMWISRSIMMIALLITGDCFFELLWDNYLFFISIY